MAERSGKEAAASQAQFDDYVRKTAGTGGAASEIEKAKQLLESGAINREPSLTRSRPRPSGPRPRQRREPTARRTRAIGVMSETAVTAPT